MRSCFYSKKNTIYSALNNTELKKVLLKKKLNKKKNSSVLPYAFYQMTFGKEFKYFKCPLFNPVEVFDFSNILTDSILSFSDVVSA